MKYLIVLLVVLVVGWLLLRTRRRMPPAPRGAARPGKALEVVACRHCGVHLPRGECLEDRTGLYCCEGHRLAGPRSE